MKAHFCPGLIVVVCFVVGAILFPARSSPRAAASGVEALYKEGQDLLKQGKPDQAMQRFEAVLEKDPDDAGAYVGLGHCYLQKKDLAAAEKAFREALRKKKNDPRAYNGLGMVFARSDKGLQWAIKYFRKAYQADRSYQEAYSNLAAVYRKVGDTRELDTYEKLVKVNPGHPDAWFQIGRIYETGTSGRYPNLEKAEAAFRRQVEVNPDHFEARTHLGAVLSEQGKTKEAIEVLDRVVRTPSPFRRRALLELARTYQKRREYDKAGALFDTYIAALPPEEQALYYDLSLVASGKELAAFRAAPKAQWKALSKAFWARRDPAPVTAANERWIEHCRRVAYAREHFSKYQFLWDVRGDVYVRYGEPDHISSSNDIRLEVKPKVVTVKERLILEAGEAIPALIKSRNDNVSATDVNNAIGPASSVRREIGETGLYRTPGPGAEPNQKANRGFTGSGPSSEDVSATSPGLMGTSSILGWPVYPVLDQVWEYWIYTDVGPGIEVTFVQKHHPGPYEYPELPASIGEGRSEIFRTWQRMNPRIVIGHVASATPSVYRPDFATQPLDFFYDSARFRGGRDSVDVEVYYGVPTRGLTYVKAGDGKSTAYLKRGVAFFDDAGNPVRRSSTEMELVAGGKEDTLQNAFVPYADRFSLAPGTYRMSLQILDPSSFKSQVYNQRVIVTPYRKGYLRLSDIEMAASIQPASQGRFLKAGLEVVPNPTRAYMPGQPAYIYYEIYNLKKDAFGQTHYRVSYQIESLESKSVVAHILGGMGKLLGVHEGQKAVTVEYEQVGEKADASSYLELDLSHSERGRYLLEVRVTDSNAGTDTVASKVFAIQGGSAR